MRHDERRRRKEKGERITKIIPQALPHKFFDTPPHLIPYRFRLQRECAHFRCIVPCLLYDYSPRSRSLLFRPPSIGTRNSLFAHLLVYPSARPFVCSRIAHCLISSRLLSSIRYSKSKVKYQISPSIPPSSIHHSLLESSARFSSHAHTHIRRICAFLDRVRFAP